MNRLNRSVRLFTFYDLLLVLIIKVLLLLLQFWHWVWNSLPSPKVFLMTLREFNHLSADRKREAVLFDGVFLAARETSCLVMLLYQVEGFYIEVVALKNKHAILKVQAFGSTDLLEPYLAEMDITEAIEHY